ncbi:ring-cleaving dioxygenase [Bacillus coahuilensis p1.1.43]|uniref:Ring-cleaving dioxygenase n=1 Tax=Bacillus coahuilensis p1.1.43 TaxID=1150625 RepID=A0A147KB84_9BACI|nr:ring-cleaving dioxygenase [Bacillus coahuilensis]KUP08291.1 ring-cleaving dioxygenase [Bacillus coahuilensis p1.1.43]
MKTLGIHHISAIVGHPQVTIDFYATVLGLRLVKQTVNFDDPSTYHLYFGNQEGEPGTIITFFPWPGARQGKIGDGQVGVTSYVIPKGSKKFWKKRLASFDIKVEETNRFGEDYLQFNDSQGLQLELVERADGKKNTWEFAGVSSDAAIQGFAGAILFSSHPFSTGELLHTGMGLQKIGEDADYTRYRSEGSIGNVIDVKKIPMGRGRSGAGTVHHLAFRAKDDHDQLQWKEHIEHLGYVVTPVKDRNYFHAVYFRERGGLLFEIATDPPGFTQDEDIEALGKALKLPPQYEERREQIESILLPIEVKDHIN